MIQVISIGPAGEAGSKLAAFSINYWGSGDTAALGAVMGSKNLKAVALRGLGMLDAEDPEAFYTASLELFASARKDRGPGALCGALGAGDLEAWLEPLAHRVRACFACPSACFTFVKYNEAPSVLESSDVEEHGMLVSNPDAALWLMDGGWEPEPAARALEAMAREGLDMMRGARELAGKPLTGAGEISSAVKALQGSEEAAWPVGDREAAAGLFGPWAPPLADAEAWRLANMAGYVLGVCPTYLMLSELELESLAGLCEPAAGVTVEIDGVADLFG